MTDLSLLIDIKDDFIGFARSLKQFTEELRAENGRLTYASVGSKLLRESLQYSGEFHSLAQEGVLLFILPYCFLFHNKGQLSLSDAIKTLQMNEGLLEETKKKMPRTTKLVTTLYWWSQDPAICRWWKMYQKSPSIMTHTPLEAERAFQSKKIFRPQTDVTLRIEYYRNFQRGVSRPNNQLQPIPDAILYVDMDLRRGANLDSVRRYFGLESLAIITDRSEYRRAFTPANENRLSPLAIYDLTHQLRHPLKIFEPHSSPLTKVKRKVHESVCDASYFLYSLIKLFVGFPEENTRYLRLSYGNTYTTVYEQVGKVTRPIGQCVQGTIAFIITQIINVLLAVIMFVISSVVYPVGKVITGSGRLIAHTVRQTASCTSTLVQASLQLSKTLLMNAPRFALSAVRFTAQLTFDSINDVWEGRMPQRIKSLYLLVPVFIWVAMTFYFRGSKV